MFGLLSPIPRTSEERAQSADVKLVRSGLFYIRGRWQTPVWNAPHTIQTFNFSGSNVQPAAFKFGSFDGQPPTSTFPAVQFKSSNVPPSTGSMLSFGPPAALPSNQEDSKVQKELRYGYEYLSDFVIDDQPYVFKASFIESTENTTGCFKLLRKKIEVLKSSSGVLHKDNEPCSIWVHLIEEGMGLHPLKRISNHWESETFKVDFHLPGTSRITNQISKPLTFLLWIEFQNCSGGEKNTLKQFSDLFSLQVNCDVNFSFKDTKESIGAHKNILSARSSVFSAMFQHDMSESNTNQVDIHDIQLEIFKLLLHYIYSGSIGISLTEMVAAQPLFAAADKYGIDDLKNECIAFLLNNIRVDNVISLMTWAHLYSVDDLKEVALNFVAQHGKDLCQQSDWESLTNNYPELCLIATRRIIETMSRNLSLEHKDAN